MYQCIAVKKGNISLFNCVFYVKNVKCDAVKSKCDKCDTVSAQRKKQKTMCRGYLLKLKK